MERYDYIEAVKEDIRDYISDMELADYTKDQLFDELFVADTVTGNASGSYTFDSYKAEEYVCHNLELLGEALYAFGDSLDSLGRGAEYCDVTIRCYVLMQCLDDVLEELGIELEDY